MADGLTTKQQRFISAYLGEAHFNATAAARIAGYRTPHPSGAETLRNPTVRARIDELLATHALTAVEVLSELSDVARAPWRDFLQIKTVHGEVVDVRMDLASKVKALELLGKAHRLFVDQVDVRVAIQREAERAAKVYGIDPQRLLAEAGRLD